MAQEIFRKGDSPNRERLERPRVLWTRHLSKATLDFTLMTQTFGTSSRLCPAFLEVIGRTDCHANRGARVISVAALVPQGFKRLGVACRIGRP